MPSLPLPGVGWASLWGQRLHQRQRRQWWRGQIRGQPAQQAQHDGDHDHHNHHGGQHDITVYHDDGRDHLRHDDVGGSLDGGRRWAAHPLTGMACSSFLTLYCRVLEAFVVWDV